MEMIAKERLNAEDVREVSDLLLREQLSIETEGYRITTSIVLNVLLKATVEKRSIESVCAEAGLISMPTRYLRKATTTISERR